MRDQTPDPAMRHDCFDLALTHAYAATEFVERATALRQSANPAERLLASTADMGARSNQVVAAAYLAVAGYDNPRLHADLGLNWHG